MAGVYDNEKFLTELYLLESNMNKKIVGEGKYLTGKGIATWLNFIITLSVLCLQLQLCW